MGYTPDPKARPVPRARYFDPKYRAARKEALERETKREHARVKDQYEDKRLKNAGN